MSDTIHSRIVRVAQSARRNARASDEEQQAIALLDELAQAEVVVGPLNGMANEAERMPPSEPAPVPAPVPEAAPLIASRPEMIAEVSPHGKPKAAKK